MIKLWFIMAKVLQIVHMIWGSISMQFLKFGTDVGKGRKQSNELGGILKWQREEVLNEKQCNNLVEKLDQVALTVNEMMTSTKGSSKECINFVEKLDQIALNVNQMMTTTKGRTNDFGLVLGELCRII